jgi:glycosyltransferase involved in cell wall biosynthesis
MARHPVLRLFKRFVLSSKYYYLVQTPPTRAVLSKVYRIPGERMIEAPFSGSDAGWCEAVRSAPDRATARKTLAIDSESFVALFVGTLIELKGIDVLLDAWAGVRSSGDLLLIAGGCMPGNEAYPVVLRERAERLGISPAVRFVGPQKRGDLLVCYRAADVFVLPSRKDTWGKVLAEAASLGLPLVATPACGAAGYVVQESRNGHVVPSNDVNALACALNRLRSRQVREAMSRESIALARTYLDRDAEYAGYAQLLDRCR